MANESDFNLEAEQAQARIILTMFRLGLVPPVELGQSPVSECEPCENGGLSLESSRSVHPRIGEVRIGALPKDRQPENVIAAVAQVLRVAGIPHRALAAAAGALDATLPPGGLALVQQDLKFFESDTIPGALLVSFRVTEPAASFILIEDAHGLELERCPLTVSGTRLVAIVSRETVSNWLAQGGVMFLCL